MGHSFSRWFSSSNISQVLQVVCNVALKLGPHSSIPNLAMIIVLVSCLVELKNSFCAQRVYVGYGWQRPLNMFGDLLSVPQCIVLPHQRLPKKFQAPQKAKSIEGVAVFG